MVRPESAKLSFVGSIPTRTSIFLFCAHLAWALDPAAVLQKAIEAKQALRPQIKDYLGREDIRYFRTEDGKARRQTGWNTYDVFVVNKDRVFRLVARDGKPLKERERTARAKTNEQDRVSFRVEDLLHHHTLQITGEANLLGRKCWILEGTLEPGAPDNVARSAGMLSSDGKIWIDQQTHWILKEEARLRRRWNGFPEGSLVTHEMLFHDQLPLTARIHLGRPMLQGKKQVLLETDQQYSDYRRFGADSAVTFNPVQ